MTCRVQAVMESILVCADPGIPIQSVYTMAVSIDEREQISSEYSMAGNAYSHTVN